MFRQYLESISGVSIYPIFSLLVFFVFFTLLIGYLVKANKHEFDEVSQLPLQETDKINE